MQERNLTDTLGCKIFDRTALIIEIFRRAAVSSEGKIQVEMALLEHLRSRLAGHGKDMAQQEGFVGGRGPGESMKESFGAIMMKKCDKLVNDSIKLQTHVKFNAKND